MNSLMTIEGEITIEYTGATKINTQNYDKYLNMIFKIMDLSILRNSSGRQ